MNKILVVFDLDFTLWNCGGTYCDHTQPPYTSINEKIYDSLRAEMTLYPDVIHILEELYHSDIDMAIASKTQASSWAEGLLERMRIRPYFQEMEMYPGSKTSHFQALQQKTGIPYSRMFFFDDEQRNIDEVATLGVNAFHVKDGIKYDDVMHSISECEPAG